MRIWFHCIDQARYNIGAGGQSDTRAAETSAWKNRLNQCQISSAKQSSEYLGELVTGAAQIDCDCCCCHIRAPGDMRLPLPQINLFPKASHLHLSLCSRSTTRKLHTRSVQLSGSPLSTMRSLNYYCDVEAEPLDQYSPGGHHPVHLGDIFSDGRYRVCRSWDLAGFRQYGSRETGCE